MTTADLVAFDCPRCAAAVSERFYGPCTACRDDLRATFAGAAKQVEVERFEPKMHVVANNVAAKGD